MNARIADRHSTIVTKLGWWFVSESLRVVLFPYNKQVDGVC